jgi:hypothetical protein
MNCKPIPALNERINDRRLQTAEIVDDDILPIGGVITASGHQ